MPDEAIRLTRILGGKWHGRYGSAHCPSHDDHTPSLSITQGENGKLLLHCFAGCTYQAILNALEGMGVKSQQAAYTPLPYAKLPDPKAMKNALAAQRLWDSATPIRNTLAEHYLRSRGLEAQSVDTLRYMAHCPHPTGKFHPAMIALIEGGGSFAIHRTYLAPDGGGKAAASPQRAMLGAANGGAVRLRSAGPDVVVAEGIETALSLTCGLIEGEYTLMAACSAAGMKSLKLPARAASLIIASDGDAAGQSAAQALAIRGMAAGWKITHLPAPAKTDWNDVLRAQKAL